MVDNQLLVQAVSRIHQRSERQDDLQKLLGTFVDVGILPQLNNKNNQVFYGRRGTGKTHVLRVLGSRLREEEHNVVTYIDARTLGSTTQYSDPDVPMGQRCLALFRDILLEMYGSILEHLVEFPSARGNDALIELENLSGSITKPVISFIQESSKDSTEYAQTDKSDFGFGLESAPKIEAKYNSGTEESKKVVQDSEFKVFTQDKVIFPDLHRYLSRTLELGECYLYVLIDEWSSLPMDIQPYLAEFLKRGMLPVQRATVKIASLEHRSNFGLPQGQQIFGFELGADISTAPDLDEYYVYDRNPESITDIYANMLFRHLSSELPAGFFEENYRVSNGKQLASRLFTERETFKELARASEGVARDLINIFTISFFHSQRRGRTSIDRKAILDSARQWFEQDKSQHLDSQLQLILRKIVDEVIGSRRARSFLLPRQLERHSLIERLFDTRVLHLMQRGYADKDNPGNRYNIYSLDYGTYVDLIGTSKQPQLEMFSEEEDPTTTEIVVPFDDKRSIRRIILSEQILDAS